MLKWLRNKLAGPVYLDCYTYRQDVYEFAKIQSATRFYPNWWKKLKNTIGVVDPNNELLEERLAPTMRGCVGFTNFFRKSLCIPLWSDLRVTIGPTNSKFHKWYFADRASKISVHEQEQRGDFMPDADYQHLKLDAPWHIKCKEEVYFAFIDPVWTSDTVEGGIITTPGLLEFKHQHSVNINMLFERDPNIHRIIDLPYNHPLVFLIPLTERRVILRYHMVTREEFEAIRKPSLTFVNVYGTARRIREQQECPMKSK